MRHKRHFSENDANALLAAIGECRRACVTALTKAEIGGPVYRGATRLASEIDIMAEVLTGNRNHFQLRPCGPFGGVPKKPPPPITVAGLWEEWKDVETGERLKSCTMIITTANEFTSDTHDRMPVILEAGAFAPWLSGGAGAELLQPAANDVLQKWPVSRRVNTSRAPGDDPTLIERIAVEAGHLSEPVLAL